MRKTYQFRAYPNKNSEVNSIRTLSTCRYLYNDSLAERKRQAELNRLKKIFDVFPWGKPEWINYYDQANCLSGSKTDFQNEVHSQVLQNVLKRVDRSFKNFTKSKAECAGKIVEFVNPSGTSQTCICGFSVPKDLSVRVHICPSCGLVMGRDQVSAILIENRPGCTVGTTGIQDRQGLSSREPMQRYAKAL
ncbi:MAG: zinc ribbon domain-containing protein [Candidatus Methanoperedenaceae archaeon]|nr:zinc ribbon domain-containing protein [Candidatus Methanoperedenaceae archaeon]